MFTGIITGIGRVVAADGGRFAIGSDYPAASIALGASICHDGVCLTVTSIEPEDAGSRYTLDVSNETLSLTTLGEWRSGRQINLERALKAGDELGGHIVSGHVDGVARIVDIRPDGESHRLTFKAPAALAPFIAPKGSVALDGTSLTVNEVEGARFGVNLIPHTLTVTTWGGKKPGDRVNIEIDPLARYVARLLEMRR
ncbi:riboflavin synthase [Hyphomicrobium sp. CS1BSMeth3]|uniref:riboflavin synthase n=1 Tax=Hyphomicrobium sp. CS1BSMeth3 TaxID=1892844 RepID=UPI0009301B97|nr:riboflavin synthase [Hyphomicrobium sp. CS1BSMeth3]